MFDGLLIPYWFVLLMLVKPRAWDGKKQKACHHFHGQGSSFSGLLSPYFGHTKNTFFLEILNEVIGR